MPMKILIENTDQIVELLYNGNSIPTRLWKGKTEKGIEVNVIVARIGVLETDDQTQFQKELQETPMTRAANYPTAFPLRLVL